MDIWGQVNIYENKINEIHVEEHLQLINLHVWFIVKPPWIQYFVKFSSTLNGSGQPLHVR